MAGLLSSIHIPLLDEVMEQLDVQGAELQEGIAALLESLSTVNDSINRLTDAIENSRETG